MIPGQVGRNPLTSRLSPLKRSLTIPKSLTYTAPYHKIDRPFQLGLHSALRLMAAGSCAPTTSHVAEQGFYSGRTTIRHKRVYLWSSSTKFPSVVTSCWKPSSLSVNPPHLQPRRPRPRLQCTFFTFTQSPISNRTSSAAS